MCHLLDATSRYCRKSEHVSKKYSVLGIKILLNTHYVTSDAGGLSIKTVKTKDVL